MQVRMEALVSIVKEIIDSGQEKKFLKRCNDCEHIATVNKELVRDAKIMAHKATVMKKSSALDGLSSVKAVGGEKNKCKPHKKKKK